MGWTGLREKFAMCVPPIIGVWEHLRVLDLSFLRYRAPFRNENFYGTCAIEG